MKTRPVLFALALIALVTASQPDVFGVTMQLKLDYGTRHAGNGGEFNASSADFRPIAMGYAASTISGGGFETFCIETNEFFNPGTTYYYGISQAAINGGASGGNPDPISLGTAWLYLNFAHGTLAGYDYSIGSGGNASAAALQTTIWWLEGEASDPGAGNIFRNDVLALPNYSMDNNGFYRVGVLNLWGDPAHTRVAQDQLVLLPDSGTTALLLGMALVTLFGVHWGINRRRSSCLA